VITGQKNYCIISGMMYNIFMISVTIRTMMLLLVISVAGCSGSVIRYINPEANFSYIKKIAVFPFNNMSDDKFAGERVRNTLTVDLLSRGVFDVLEQGEVSKVMGSFFRAAGFEEGRALEVDKETLKLLGERLGVQAIILRSVDEYKSRGGRGSAVVALSVRMLDTSSGIILWQAKSTVSGSSPWRKIVGIEESDRSTIARKAVKSVLDTLL
jgi:TolB-like protein